MNYGPIICSFFVVTTIERRTSVVQASRSWVRRDSIALQSVYPRWTGLSDSVLDFVTSASNYSFSSFYHGLDDWGLQALHWIFFCGLHFLGWGRKSWRSDFTDRRKWKRFGYQWCWRNSRTSERCVWSDPGQNGWFVELISRCTSGDKHAQYFALKTPKLKIVDTHSELRCIPIPGNLNRLPG